MPNKTIEKQLTAHIHGLYLNFSFMCKINHSTIRTSNLQNVLTLVFHTSFCMIPPLSLLSKHNSFKDTLQII